MFASGRFRCFSGLTRSRLREQVRCSAFYDVVYLCDSMFD